MSRLNELMYEAIIAWVKGTGGFEIQPDDLPAWLGWQTPDLEPVQDERELGESSGG